MTQMTKTKRKLNLNLSEFSGGDKRNELAALYEATVKSFSEGSIVPGRIVEIRNQEVLVDIGYKSEGVITAEEFGDLSKAKVGDEIQVFIVEMDDDEGVIILSKRQADEILAWQKLVSNYKEGSVVEGLIAKTVKGGFAVDIAGIEAFLPGSHVDIAPAENMESYVGQKFEFKILKITPERRNIIVSRRELLEERARQRKEAMLASIKVGDRVKGIVKNITDFGVFVDLNGLDGLIHITDLSWGRIKHPSEVVSMGQEIEVVITDIDREKERVSLGLKQLSPNPWENIEQKYPVGSRVRGRVINIAPYGAFIELEKGVEGLVHVSEMSWTKRITKASDVVSIGQEVDVVVLSVNKEEQKISLGMRQTVENPWDTVETRYPVGSRVIGTVRNFTSYGAFVELEEGIDGMIHISDMSWTRKINHPSEILQKGDKVEVVILEVDAANRRIALGLKQTTPDPWDTILSRYKVGQKVKGKVSKLTSFGAFVELEEGIDGLVHVSQISDKHVEKVRDVLTVGQEVEARIIKLDRSERRIGLSIKAASMSEEEFMKQLEKFESTLKPGENLVDLAGAFEQVLGTGNIEEWRPGQTEQKSEETKKTETNTNPSEQKSADDISSSASPQPSQS
jgi:small subunit ribosomal protein S1